MTDETKSVMDLTETERRRLEELGWFDHSKPFDYRKLRPPEVSMYDPIPKELLRNLPPWVGKLQLVGYLLMLPFAIVLIAAFAMQALGYY